MDIFLKSHVIIKSQLTCFFLLSFEGESWQSLKTEHPSFAEKDLSECSVSQEGLI